MNKYYTSCLPASSRLNPQLLQSYAQAQAQEYVQVQTNVQVQVQVQISS